VGAAAHRSGDQLRLVLSSIAAAAALYGAVVLLGLGPTSPWALDREQSRPPQVVPLSVRDHVAPRPVRRGPQPSPGPAQLPVRPQAHTPVRPALRTHPARTPQLSEQPAPTRATTPSAAPSYMPAATVPRAPELLPIPSVDVPTLPEMEVPPIPAPALSVP
jgi:hypothetical protein